MSDADGQSTRTRLEAIHAPPRVIMDVWTTTEHLNLPRTTNAAYCELLASSNYTVVPVGFGLNSYRFAEAALSGSVPIVIADGLVLPFDDQIA